MIRCNPRRRPLLGADLTAALNYYGVPSQSLARLSGVKPQRILFFRKLDGASEDSIPLWVEWALLAFELDESLRRNFRIEKAAQKIGLEVSDTAVSTESFNRALSELAVSIGTFARHTGRNILAVHDYAKGVKPVPRWACWPLVMYANHPEARTVEMPLDLPFDAWHQSNSAG